MQLDEIKLHNYKIHRDLKLKLGAGVTGIIGDNGSGKSSVISAIRFLFTGEVDTDTKEKTITIGETEGWVSGNFTLNGKEGYLERHLATSKVVLRYNDVTYNKSAEVKDLWAKLLQIDGTIFNNVIVAAQGDIPMLFSGDGMVREKIFQKIFLVPPTERLRSTIWDHYIKPCPPEKFEEDEKQLQAQEVNIAAKRNKLLAGLQVKREGILPDMYFKCVMERIAFLEKCKLDEAAKPDLEHLHFYLDGMVHQLDDQIAGEEETLAKIDFASLKKAFEQLVSQKRLAAHKAELENELVVAESRAPSEQELTEKYAEVETAEIAETEAKQALDEANALVKTINTQIEEFSKLEGHQVCPTCKQPIVDIANALVVYKEEADKAQRAQVLANTSYVLVNKKAQRLRGELSLMESQQHRVNNLKLQLMRYADVTYSEQDLTDLNAAIARVEEIQAQSQKNKQDRARLNGDLGVTVEKLKNLAIYDGTASIDDELADMNQLIVQNKQRIAELEDIRVEQAKLEHELELLEERIAVSLENQKYNTRRRTYLDRLESAYAILHVSEFPRKLIQTYADHVQLYLSNYLEKFSLPYRARIQEGFKIQMLNSDGKEIPEVSGGQKMIVGICLRLALHKMFAQSFPLWIVDEGTTHLDENNRTAYFQLVDDIRRGKVVSQVLIIDHDKHLQTVVDRTIQM